MVRMPMLGLDFGPPLAAAALSIFWSGLAGATVPARDYKPPEAKQHPEVATPQERSNAAHSKALAVNGS